MGCIVLDVGMYCCCGVIGKSGVVDVCCRADVLDVDGEHGALGYEERYGRHGNTRWWQWGWCGEWRE